MMIVRIVMMMMMMIMMMMMMMMTMMMMVVMLMMIIMKMTMSTMIMRTIYSCLCSVSPFFPLINITFIILFKLTKVIISIFLSLCFPILNYVFLSYDSSRTV